MARRLEEVSNGVYRTGFAKTQKAYNDELAKTAELQQQLGESDEDEYDIDVKEPTAKDLKKDSIATTASMNANATQALSCKRTTSSHWRGNT